MNKSIILLLLIFISGYCFSEVIPSSARSVKAIKKVELSLISSLSKVGLNYGSPIYIRIFKESEDLELWVKSGDKFKLFKTYKICYFSGELGPKTKQGDNQAPEGFYFVRPGNLNPWSSFHLSFNLGYPNTYDRAHGYTGSALMVHGNCVSIGCYAMTDEYINEIYALITKAFENGQPFFRVHVFPFRLEKDTLSKYTENKWYSFWKNLQEGYSYFNANLSPPNVTVRNREYHFE